MPVTALARICRGRNAGRRGGWLLRGLSFRPRGAALVGRGVFSAQRWAMMMRLFFVFFTGFFFFIIVGLNIKMTSWRS